MCNNKIAGIVTGNVTGISNPIIVLNMRNKKGAATIHDVAREAGVSVSTVSRVLNNKDDVASLYCVEVMRGVNHIYLPNKTSSSSSSHANNSSSGGVVR